MASTHLQRVTPTRGADRGAALPAASDIAIDLGSATTRVVVRGEGLVVDCDTVAACEPRRGHVVSIGAEARALVAADPRLTLVHPVAGRAIADQKLAQEYLSMALKPLAAGWTGRADVLTTCSEGSTPIERRALRDVCRRAGAAQVRLIEKAVAAGLGAGVAVHDPAATLVVELGAGTTEVALLALGSVVAAASSREGNADIDSSIQSGLRHEFGLRLSDVAAEKMKCAVDGADQSALVEATGTTVVDGEMVTAIFEVADVSVHLSKHSERVGQVVKECLVKCTPEMASDVLSSGILLTGGPAQSQQLVKDLQNELAMSVRAASNPRLAAVMGAAKCLEAVDSLSELFVTDRG